MTTKVLWQVPLFQETCVLVLGFLVGLALLMFFLRNRGGALTSIWKSTQNWLLAAPILFFVIALPGIGPFVALTLFSIYCAKIFFQMVGMYHRSWFIWATYGCILGLTGALHWNHSNLFNLMPMLLLALSCLIPIALNSYKHMIQYIALTLLAFCLMGWALMHLGRIFLLPKGPFILLYIIVLTEFSDNVFLIASQTFKKFKPWSQITKKRSLEGFFVALLSTLVLAWALRHLLPVREPVIWMTSGVIACCAGGLGDLILTIIRRDLGIKDEGGFILSNGNPMILLDRLIFVAPVYYYIMSYLFIRS